MRKISNISLDNNSHKWRCKLCVCVSVCFPLFSRDLLIFTGKVSNFTKGSNNFFTQASAEVHQRYRIFFLRKRLEGIHTFVLDEICFFVSAFWKKKKQVVFFFPWKSLDATHSPEKKSVYTKDEVTLVKRDKNSVLYRSIP